MARSLIVGAATLMIASCVFSDTSDPNSSAEIKPDTSQNVETASLARTVSHPDTSAEITETDLAERLKIVASDTFKGRAPGTEAGEAAAEWIAHEMERVGLTPAVDGSWYQPVQMVAQTVDLENSHLTITTNGEPQELEPGANTVFWTKRQIEGPVTFDDSEMVFVGYGIVAPEYGWDDYAGVDMAGKTAVILINDPGFATQDPKLFNGNAMTYYGRWTYKFEEAARQGADAAIIVHETAPAAYGWNVVTGSWAGEQADLVRKENGIDRVPLEGWITHDYAKSLFSKVGKDFDALKKAAEKPGFEAVALEGATAAGEINQSISYMNSNNVAGMIEGKTAPDEYVIFTAHWDHLGEKINFATDDAIHNGAVDNASGVSTVLDIAEKFATGPQPERSVLFLFVTLEESGLLGSAYFADNPFVPLDQIVAGVNIDGALPRGRAKNMEVVGSGSSELEDMLADILAKDGRVTSPDSAPQNGYFFRSDHISLAKKGVPMLYAEGGADLVEGGVEAGLKAAALYTANDYHKPSDEFDPNWDFSGMVENAKVFHELAENIANSENWPNWYEGHAFKAIRDKSRQ